MIDLLFLSFNIGPEVDTLISDLSYTSRNLDVSPSTYKLNFPLGPFVVATMIPPVTSPYCDSRPPVIICNCSISLGGK